MPAFRTEFAKLTDTERAQLVELLSTCGPSEFEGLSKLAPTRALKRILQFYVPIAKDDLRAIWSVQSEIAPSEVVTETDLAEDERVEDAGLYDDGLEQPSAAERPLAGTRVAA